MDRRCCRRHDYSVLVLLHKEEPLQSKNVLVSKYADMSMHLVNIDTPVISGTLLQVLAWASPSLALFGNSHPSWTTCRSSTHSTLSRRTTSIRGLRHEDFSAPRRHARDVAHAILDANAAAVPLLAAIACIETRSFAMRPRIRIWPNPRPLDGIPVLIKDELDATTRRSGTSFLGALLGPATADSIAVGHLRHNGAVISHTERVLGQPHVWRVGDRGSRALALRCGSIRTPAAFNGVTGIKATFMRIPELARTDPSMANVGPIAATVQDAAVAYDVLSGSHTDVPTSQVQTPPTST
ncbi:hypothetical protein H257_15340 [Aphanomyces astaci]|uniref:Amidase domain-containing protein n=1 Tax=Aphanomyces astaci TaxID=112090 RepID=W4FPA4_APHAT|nr:hypothetical protein H257_15340 [Aphanomyces astaci]ETV68771.1 hypothetical protein H257_15340 [Aphanomyces astaci]|eukprot:XP_009841725.1 hypothetical protein H257_15340 [Aphanomyces astaci]